MSSPARVHSIEALETFRAILVVYLEKAGRILEDALGDVIRTRVWLETDCRLNWKRQIRERSKLVAQAEAELLTAKLSGHPEAVQDRRMALAKAKRALEEVQAKLDRVERWLRHYEAEVHAHTQAITRLQQVFDHDMQKAVGFLQMAAATLADYADLMPEAPPSDPAAPVTSSGPETAPPAPLGGAAASQEPS